MINTVFLDIDNTLLDFDECARQATIKSFRDLGLAYRDEYFPVFIEENDRLWQEIENGTLTRAELHRIRWQCILDRVGVNANGLMVEELFLRYIEDPPAMIPGALDLLSYLAPKYTLCLASNASQKRQEKRLAGTGILPYVDEIFLSEIIGIPKPEKGFFDACFARLPNASPETSVIIGDSLSADIAGGIACGMKTCWFNLKNWPVPSDMPIDYIVHSLGEIKTIL